MVKRIGFYGLVGSLIFSIILNHFIESGWINIIFVVGIIFAFLYKWEEIRALSRKKKLIFTSEFIILVPTVVFLLIEGQKKITNLSIFQGWLFLAKLLYMFAILIVFGIFVTKVNEKLLVSDDKPKT